MLNSIMVYLRKTMFLLAVATTNLTDRLPAWPFRRQHEGVFETLPRLEVNLYLENFDGRAKVKLKCMSHFLEKPMYLLVEEMVNERYEKEGRKKLARSKRLDRLFRKAYSEVGESWLRNMERKHRKANPHSVHAEVLHQAVQAGHLTEEDIDRHLSALLGLTATEAKSPRRRRKRPPATNT